MLDLDSKEASCVMSNLATLVVGDEAQAGVPQILYGELPLTTLADHVGQHRYVLATDDHGRISGIASTDDIFRRLNSENPHERTRWQQMPIRSLLCATLTEAAPNPSPPLAEEREVKCVAILEDARLFGLAVDDDLFLSWKRLESLLSVAFLDPLTGLMNRLAYERRLNEEWSRATRTGTSIGVVVVDLDGFKQVNDQYGHQAGDKLLAAVGLTLEAAMRSYDVVARLGGDEFVALCVGCERGDIAIPLSRIQKSINDLEVEFARTTVNVSVSIGAAVRHEGFENSSPSDLFAAADDCLYQAKASSDQIWLTEFGSGCPGTSTPVRTCLVEAANP